RSHTLSRMMPDARIDRHVAECSVAIVSEQLIGERRVMPRMAIRAQAWRLLAAVRLARGIPHAVIHDEQIEPAVAIEVEPGAVDAPHRSRLWMHTRQMGLRGDVAERSVSEIAIEDIAPDARDEEIRKSVVVEIRCRGAHHVAVPLHAGELGHVGKTAVAEVS